MKNSREKEKKTMLNLKNVNPAIEDSLKKAESIEDIIAVFKSEGTEISLADAEEICKKLQEWKVRQQKADQPEEEPENFAIEDGELSLDELDAISGGQSFLHHGCEATVEFGSSCFLGTDNCSFAFNYYTYEPVEMRCPYDGGIGAKYEYHPNIAICKTCHTTYNYVTGEYDPLKVHVNF